MNARIIFSFVFVLILVDLLNAQNNKIKEVLDISEQPVYYSLKKALRNAEKVYKLNLSNTELKEIPADVFKLKELRYLFLDSNQISTIPHEIKSLEKLEVLSIGNNNIHSVPSEIGILKNLKYLYFDYNKIIDLPPELFFLINLEELYINP